jgi:hypothetical protein
MIWQLLQKYGGTSVTVDPDFEKQRKNLENIQKSLLHIIREITRHDEVLKSSHLKYIMIIII